jgi:hypothetical protein
MVDLAATGAYKVKEARLGVTTIVAVISTCVGMGITWGAYANRLAEVERKAEDAQKATVQLAVLNAQYTEILRRLDRIERQAK